MTLVEQITTDMTTAMKSGDSARTAVLRLVMSSLKNEQIKLGHELNADEALKLVQREAKQRRDSIDAYQQADRTDLVEAEQAELKIITEYLPEQMSDEELNKIVAQAITDTEAKDMSQMGAVIGKVMSQVAGKAEGGAVSRVVKEQLGSL
jgi:uncharacterized protein YqeY